MGNARVMVCLVAFAIVANGIAGEHARIPAEPFKVKGLQIAVATPEAGVSAFRLATRLSDVLGADVQTGGVGNIVFELADWRNRQEYEIVTRPDKICLRASDSQGFAFATADFLHELGFRRFAPHRSWEIRPSGLPDSIRIGRRESPDYRFRSIWGWLDPEHRRNGDHDAWNFANRMGGEQIRTGHSYERFVRIEKAFFREHQECLALVDGERKGNKLCISNPLLRERFVRYELDQIRGDPSAISVSAEPSDCDGWCECAACAKLGTPTDRAVFLANEVAKALRAEFPGKVVGMYAYNAHSPPPNVSVGKGVIVFVATAFLREGWTVDGLIEEWGRRTHVGIREYYYAKGLPGEGQAADTAYLARTIPAFFAKNANWMSAESSDSWIPGLMGFNVAAALMWNVKENPECVKADLIEKAFPSCRKSARTFFDLIDGANRRPVCEDLFARMYEALGEAWAAACVGTDDERGRLRQLIAYTLFAERLNDYYGSPSAEKARGFLEIAGALRPYYSIQTYSYFRDGRPFGDPGKELSNAFDWKASRPLPEVEPTIRGGLARNRKLQFTPVDFGADAVVRKGLEGAKGRGELRPVRGAHAFSVWSDGHPFDLKVTGGLIEHYRNRGNVKLKLVQIGGESATGELETTVFQDASVPPDGDSHVVRIVPKHAGLHRLEVSDGNDRTRYEFPLGLPVAVHVEREKVPEIDGTFFFYVPKGTKTLGYYAATDRGKIMSPNGAEVETLAKKRGFYQIDVPRDADGKVWKVSDMRGVFRPLTAPPWLNLDRGVLVLPRCECKKGGMK